ncbi:hypothetical protein CJ030_MR2G005636 [Morella rubra]|uniref:Uncharacterized protein n=1 Tax=Morella rubra TaxID=262757 RepID=A0A6A1W7S0_9ROSI|nr:hypothetical protein CJ030_MR2G005636 [Morella rubra]
MESTLCLRYGPLPTLPLHIPSLVRSAWVTKPQFSFSHSSLSLSIPDRSSYRPLGHAFSSVVSAINRFPTPSTNDESDNKIVRGSTVGASLALATVLAMISWRYTMNPKAIAASFETLQRSSSTKEVGSPVYAKGGKAALKSLLDMTVYLTSSPTKLPPEVPKKPQRKLLSGEDVEYLKLEAMSVMKSGQGDEAVKRLTKKYNDCKGAESKFLVEMALVEVLICLGKYEDALKCKCLSERPSERLPSDGRVPLYKAIIYTMMDKKEDAKECWEDFIGAIDGGLPPLEIMI